MAHYRGLTSKDYGNIFEDMFYKTCQLNGIAITRIPDGCKQINSVKIVRVKTPWDWILTWECKTALIDTKTALESTFACSAIKSHQVLELLNHERLGAIAGYVVWLRKSNKVFFLAASVLLSLMQRGGSFSDTHPRAILLGSHFFDARLIFSKENENEMRKAKLS